MSLEEAVRRSVEGLAGKLLLSTAVGAIMAITGATLHTVYIDHSKELTGISQKLDDLVVANEERTKAEDQRAAVTDAAIAKMADSEQQHSVAIARAEEQIEALERPPNSPAPWPYHPMRESYAAPSAPNVIDALTHIFNPRHFRRGH